MSAHLPFDMYVHPYVSTPDTIPYVWMQTSYPGKAK